VSGLVEDKNIHLFGGKCFRSFWIVRDSCR